VVCGACFKDFVEAAVVVVLFLIAEDTAREPWEVIRSGEETGYAWDVDDVCTDVEGKWEREGFHFGFSGYW
jgi:hypothetical protein